MIDNDNENLLIDKTIRMTMVIEQKTDVSGKAAVPAAEPPSGKKNRFMHWFSKFFCKQDKESEEHLPLTTPIGGDMPGAKKISGEGDSLLQDVHKRYFFDIKPFASGGQGDVTRAEDLALGCSNIAIKSLHKKLHDDLHARASFFNEAKLMASLDHPGIIPVHGLFSDNENGLHLAMKMIEGCNLRGYLNSVIAMHENKHHGSFDEGQSLFSRLEIMLRVCDAVRYAHDQGILHRDLKLENIIVGKYRKTYVTDWGIALKMEDAKSLEKVLGTPGFVAPEVIKHKHSDRRSDVYSLGVILFELVLLKPAFPGKNVKVVLDKVCSGDHASLHHRFNCRVDRDLLKIIEKAIEPDPDMRYQNVDMLAEDLRRFIANEEVSANPDTFISRICRWGVNHRRGMLMTTMIVLLLSFGMVACSLQREKQTAILNRQKEHAVNMVYGDVLRTANQIEQNVITFENIVKELEINVEFSAFKKGREIQAMAKSAFASLASYKNDRPINMVKDQLSGHLVDLEHVCFFNIDKNIELTPEQLSHLDNSVNHMIEAYEDSCGWEQEDGQLGCARKIYFVLADGTVIFYPGSGEVSEEWRQKLRRLIPLVKSRKNIMTWLPPYNDHSEEYGVWTTCATPVFDRNENYIGFVAVDISLTRLASDFAEGKGNSACREKMLIDVYDKVLWRYTATGYNGKKFYDEKLIYDMREREFGTIEIMVDGKPMLLVFATIRSLKMLYVEYIDLNELIEKRQQENPTDPVNRNINKGKTV